MPAGAYLFNSIKSQCAFIYTHPLNGTHDHADNLIVDYKFIKRGRHAEFQESGSVVDKIAAGQRHQKTGNGGFITCLSIVYLGIGHACRGINGKFVKLCHL